MEQINKTIYQGNNKLKKKKKISLQKIGLDKCITSLKSSTHMT